MRKKRHYDQSSGSKLKQAKASYKDRYCDLLLSQGQFSLTTSAKRIMLETETYTIK